MAVLYKIGAGFVLALTIVAGIWLYGNHRDTQGWTRRDVQAKQKAAQILAQSRDKEIVAQQQMEKLRNDAYQQKQVSDAAVSAARAESDRLRDEAKRRIARLKATGTTTRTNAELATAWKLLNTCQQRYTAVAADADGYVHDIRLGQGWAEVIERVSK